MDGFNAGKLICQSNQLLCEHKSGNVFCLVKTNICNLIRDCKNFKEDIISEFQCPGENFISFNPTLLKNFGSEFSVNYFRL